MLDTIAAKIGGCALERVCKRESQTLARRSDLSAVQAQPGFHEIMPRCLRVCMCVCVSHEASSWCPLAPFTQHLWVSHLQHTWIACRMVPGDVEVPADEEAAVQCRQMTFPFPPSCIQQTAASCKKRPAASMMHVVGQLEQSSCMR